MTRTIVPETMDDRERFEMNRTEGKERLSKGKGGVDDKMESYYGNSGFLMEPLKVMLGAYLEGGWFCEGEVGSWLIEGAMM